jgi:formylglycine-generating enzyme required for sulfatase activity
VDSARSIGQDPAAAIRSRESIGAAQTTAARDEPNESFRDCDDCPEMVVIPAGEFLLGSETTGVGRSIGLVERRGMLGQRGDILETAHSDR